MKKNITINLFGTLYAIDEDAYELLDRYLEDLKSYFASKEGGEEIADDIEHRVAELMQELKTDGREPVTIEVVKEIIGRIGQPEEMDNGDADAGGSGNVKGGHRGREWFSGQMQTKRLYCNPDDKMLCGLLSGISCYLGVDAVWTRIIVVMLAVLPLPFIIIPFWSVALAYFILALVVPEAKTPEDRLRMQGKPVTMKTLNEEIVNNADSAERPTPARSKLLKFFDGLVSVIAVLLKVFLVMILFFVVFVSFLFLMVILSAGTIMGAVISESGLLEQMSLVSEDMLMFGAMSGNYWTWVSGGAFVIFFLIIIYLLIHMMLRMFGKSKPIGRTLWMYLTILLLSLIVGVSTIFPAWLRVNDGVNSLRNITENKAAIEWLTERGWKILENEHAVNYINHGEHYSGDYRKIYIDAYSDNPTMIYTLERTVQVTPGIYRLEAAVRADGEGPEIYAYDSEGNRLSASFPVYGNRSGKIWQEAFVRYDMGDKDMEHLAKVNGKNGYGWSYVAIDNIHITDSVIRYGVTNREHSDGFWNGKWFSASDFKLKKLK